MDDTIPRSDERKLQQLHQRGTNTYHIYKQTNVIRGMCGPDQNAAVCRPPHRPPWPQPAAVLTSAGVLRGSGGSQAGRPGWTAVAAA